MKSRGKTVKTQLSESEIDDLAEAQADNSSAWESAIRVRRGKNTPLSLPADLTARAVFLAKLHHERNLQTWLARIIKERVELEERAFAHAKRALSVRSPS